MYQLVAFKHDEATKCAFYKFNTSQLSGNHLQLVPFQPQQGVTNDVQSRHVGKKHVLSDLIALENKLKLINPTSKGTKGLFVCSVSEIMCHSL